MVKAKILKPLFEVTNWNVKDYRVGSSLRDAWTEVMMKKAVQIRWQHGCLVGNAAESHAYAPLPCVVFISKPFGVTYTQGRSTYGIIFVSGNFSCQNERRFFI